MRVKHIRTIDDHLGADHVASINAALLEEPDDVEITFQHSVTAIDMRGDYTRGIGSGWLFSTLIIIRD